MTRRLLLPLFALILATSLSSCALARQPMGVARGIMNVGAGTARATATSAIRTTLQTAKELAPYVASAAMMGL